MEGEASARLLLERRAEVETIAETLDRLAEGRSSIIAITGDAGVGKTALLTALQTAAVERGMRLLSARAASLDADFAFGIVRQLFEPVLHAAGAVRCEELLSGAAKLATPLVSWEADVGMARGADPTFAALHGLYWLTSNIAASGPLVIAVDDAQWADLASQRWLAYLAPRLEGLGLLLAVTVRDRDPGAATQWLSELLRSPDTERLRPAPLTPAAVSELVGTTFAAVPHDTFVTACHGATGGNPFLLGEMLMDLAGAGIEPTAAEAGRIGHFGSGSVSRAVLSRISRMPRGSLEVAQAVAVVGGRAGISTVAAVAGLTVEEASASIDALAIARILRPDVPLDFVHPVVGASILRTLAPSARSRAHRRAAEALHRENAGPGRVGAQLLAVDPCGDSWVVQHLRAAGRDALQRGAPEAAARFFARALAGPPTADDRGSVLAELGWAESLAMDEQNAVVHLQQALDHTSDPTIRGHVVRTLATALLVRERTAEAAELLRDAIAALPTGERELRLRMEADLCAIGHLGFEAWTVARGRLDDIEFDSDEPGGLAVMGGLATHRLHTHPAAVGRRLARRATADGRLLREEGADLPTFYAAAAGLMVSGDYLAADAAYSAAVASATERGSGRGLTAALGHRALVWSLRGSVAHAEADALAYLQHGPRGVFVGLPLALAALVWAYTQRGEITAADELLREHAQVDVTSEHIEFQYLLHARAELHLAAGRIDAALEDLQACERLDLRYEMQWPALVPWAATMALALRAAHRDAEAHTWVGRALAGAERFDQAIHCGAALRAAGLVRGSKDRRILLERAVSHLSRTPAIFDHARALVDLGQALVREGEVVDGCERLKEGIGLARERGSLVLVERAYQALAATGTRPRRIMHTGVEALTASERRIAELASAGKTNRDIAQGLFVTVKTVETHLAHTYRKLGIRSRSQLRHVLCDSESAPVP